MVKGVNRLVLEIPQPESEYFEKIILFVKPEYVSENEGTLKARASDFLRAAISPPKPVSSPGRLRAVRLLKYVFCTGAGAAILAVVQALIR